jgi:ADP-ribose pyrophosphatase YjhB (NUDIX family)
VAEETGYQVELIRLVDVYAGRRWAGEGGVVRVVYEAHVVGGELLSSSEGEARWEPLTELARGSGRDAPIIRDWLGRGVPA